jgi:hypothetical protein
VADHTAIYADGRRSPHESPSRMFQG